MLGTHSKSYHIAAFVLSRKMRRNINIQVIKKHFTSERLLAIFATRYVAFPTSG
jgi:hypothetical protein